MKTYWHFTQKNFMLNYDMSDVEATVGRTVSVAGDIYPCSNGLHASKDLVDAMRYADTPFLTMVELEGDMFVDTTKVVARHRKVIARANIGDALLNNWKQILWGYLDIIRFANHHIIPCGIEYEGAKPVVDAAINAIIGVGNNEFHDTIRHYRQGTGAEYAFERAVRCMVEGVIDKDPLRILASVSWFLQTSPSGLLKKQLDDLVVGIVQDADWEGEVPWGE